MAKDLISPPNRRLSEHTLHPKAEQLAATKKNRKPLWLLQRWAWHLWLNGIDSTTDASNPSEGI